MFGKIKNFITEVTVELKKVAWTTKSELIDSTWLVIISSVFLGFFIFSADSVLSQLVKFIIR